MKNNSDKEINIMRKLEQMCKETGARPFIFTGNSIVPPTVIMPEEVNDFLTSSEISQAKMILIRELCSP
jgi:hypothetical protein